MVAISNDKGGIDFIPGVSFDFYADEYKEIHREAPADWWVGMGFNTPLSPDLAHAGTAIQAALAGR